MKSQTASGSLFLVCYLGQFLYGQAAYTFQSTAYFTDNTLCETPNWQATTPAAGYYATTAVDTCIGSGSGVSYKIECSASGLTYTVKRYNGETCAGSVTTTNMANKAVNTCVDPWNDFLANQVFLRVNCYESDPFAVPNTDANIDDNTYSGTYSFMQWPTTDCSGSQSNLPGTGVDGECTSYEEAYGTTTDATSAYKAYKGYVSTDGTQASFIIYGDTACKSDTFLIQTSGPPDTCIQVGTSSYKITDGTSSDTVDEAAFCFAGTESVLLESGSVIQMEDVQLGDRIQVASTSDGSLSFAEVISLPHDKNTQSASFIELETSSGASLKVTPYHLVMSGTCGTSNMGLIFAQDVTIGDCMDTINGEVMVTAAMKSQGRGVYSIITSHIDGIIVVNGFKASSFAVSHAIGNHYYHIHRALYSYMPDYVGIKSIIASVATQIALLYEMLHKSLVL